MTAERLPLTGINVLICGAGVSGLYAALECWRNGHNVRVIELRVGADPAGDFFTIGPAATSALKHWPDFKRDYESVAYDAYASYWKHTGEHVYGPVPFPVTQGPILLRPAMHECLLRNVKNIGIKIETGRKVVGYYEDIDRKCGIVELANGERLEADVVLAADGVHSKSWKLVIPGDREEAQSSGFSAYRAAFSVKDAHKDPVVAKQFKTEVIEGKTREIIQFWAGPESHCVTTIGADVITFALFHKDAGTASESWMANEDPQIAVDFIHPLGWCETFQALIKSAPKLNDWRLMWRNPHEKWVSPGGCVVQIGDAAHSLLPTSAQGASQAMEDSITIAACLRIGGKPKSPISARIYNKLRFERASCAAKAGLRNRESWHKTDWKAVSNNPSRIVVKAGIWLAHHDPEDYAIEMYPLCEDHLLNGTPFKNTNTPPGYEYKPWTIQQVSADAAAGKLVPDEGNWD